MNTYLFELCGRRSILAIACLLLMSCGGTGDETPSGGSDTTTPTPAVSPMPTDTPNPVMTLSPVPVNTPTPRPNATASPLPQNTPTPNPGPTASPAPQSTPTARPSPIASSTPQSTPTPQPIPTNSPVPVNTPSPVPTATASPVPQNTPTPNPQATDGPALVRASNTSCIAPAQGAQTGDYELEAQFTARGFPRLNGLVGLHQIPGDSSTWYALLRGGEVRRFANSPDTTRAETFLSLNNVDSRGEKGLLGFAFHPDYLSNGYIYVSYNDSENRGRSTISRFRSINGARIDSSSEFVILTLNQPAENHNGGDIQFGPDGYLYIGFGDGGGGGDTFRNGQNKKTWHSKILRIDVNSTSRGKNYRVPDDNPFVNDDSFLPEIYAHGLRNPWRFSFDKQNGDFWLADVGQDRIEEVNLVEAGDNFGWPVMEGSRCFRGNGCNNAQYKLPVAEYDHSDGACSVTGGYVYRGADLPGLSGNYIYADYCNGVVRRTFRKGGAWETARVLNAGFEVVAFAQDNEGETYILNIEGRAGSQIYRIKSRANTQDVSNIASRLSQTGCYRSTRDKEYADALVPYDVKSKLWSDGANKRRAFAIPDNSTINVLEDGDFEFPVGSILVKDFLDGDTYLETRLLMHHENAWVGYSYEWLEDQSDAVLLKGGKTRNVGDFIHTYPSTGECQSCHTSSSNISLGLEAAQLNHGFAYPRTRVSANQLDSLEDAGFLANSPDTNAFIDLASLDESSKSINDRARSYLHSNCAGCHRPGAQGSILDLRRTTALVDTGACDQRPNTGDLGISNARIIAPGDAIRSVLLSRMKITGDDRMPPLGSLIEDQAATALIETWINGLSSCDAGN